MLNEKILDVITHEKNDRDKAIFLFSLMQTLFELKNIEKVTSVYLYFNEKLEIYVFTKDEDTEIEEKIIYSIAQWESEQKYFPETYIRIEGEEINELPRGAFRIW